MFPALQIYDLVYGRLSDLELIGYLPLRKFSTPVKLPDMKYLFFGEFGIPNFFTFRQVPMMKSRSVAFSPGNSFWMRLRSVTCTSGHSVSSHSVPRVGFCRSLVNMIRIATRRSIAMMANHFSFWPFSCVEKKADTMCEITFVIQDKPSIAFSVSDTNPKPASDRGRSFIHAPPESLNLFRREVDLGLSFKEVCLSIFHSRLWNLLAAAGEPTPSAASILSL